eukprot:Selendium_serpulae@DN3302_c0_g2_i1.p1
MYNGIGLQTPRGSGTSGYIQRNLSFVKPKRTDFDKRPGKFGAPGSGGALGPGEAVFGGKSTSGAPRIRKANADILNHERRRKVEAELLEFRETLESDASGICKAAIDQQVEGRRAVLMAKLDRDILENADSAKLNSHQMAEKKDRELANLRKALNIGEDHKVGAAFDPEEVEKRRLERQQERKLKEAQEIERQKEREETKKREGKRRRREAEAEERDAKRRLREFETAERDRKRSRRADSSERSRRGNSLERARRGDVVDRSKATDTRGRSRREASPEQPRRGNSSERSRKGEVSERSKKADTPERLGRDNSPERSRRGNSSERPRRADSSE